MKNNHTRLTRLAAISLCLVMCLSVVPFMAPSASAAGEDAPPTSPPASAAAGEGGEGRGYVCIMFDDGWMEVYEHAFPIMAAADIPGTAFIVTDWIGGVGSDNTPCMDEAELLDLQANGWTIGSHTLSHPNLTYKSLEEAKREMRESKAALEAIGIECSTFAYPQGKYNATLVDYGSGLYDRQRTTDGINQFKHDYPNGMPVMGSREPKSLEEAKELIDIAVASDSVVMLLHHHVEADGYLPGNDYYLQDLVDYIVETGIRPIGFADLPNSAPHADIYVWDGEGADDLASNPQNWRKVAVTGTITNDVAPVSGAILVWNATSNTPCTWDLDIAAHSWNINHGYTAKITQGDVDIRVSEGLTFTSKQPRASFEPNPDRAIYVGGDLTLYTASHLEWVDAHIIMTGYKSSIDGGARIGELTVAGVAHVVAGSIDVDYLDVPGYMGITSGAAFKVFDRLQEGVADILRVTGRLGGEGTLNVLSYTRDISLDLRNIDVNMVSVRLSSGAAAPRTIYISASADDLRNIEFRSNHASHSLTVDLAGNTLAAEGVTVGERCVVGNGSVHTSTWDSTAGSVLDNTTVVLRDGGSAVLAAGQSFNELYIASDDGRASWTMTATGTQAPIVTGLRSGKGYLWYLDGEEQGVIEADEDGTIALSYVSTGLHTLSVESASMAIAIDSVYQAVGIVAVLAVIGGLFTMIGRLKF